MYVRIEIEFQIGYEYLKFVGRFPAEPMFYKITKEGTRNHRTMAWEISRRDISIFFP